MAENVSFTVKSYKRYMNYIILGTLLVGIAAGFEVVLALMGAGIGAIDMRLYHVTFYPLLVVGLLVVILATRHYKSELRDLEDTPDEREGLELVEPA